MNSEAKKLSRWPQHKEKDPLQAFLSEAAESRALAEPAINGSCEIPFGAVHVDDSGVVLEHRQVDTRISFPSSVIVGRSFIAIAPWAEVPGFISALKSAIQRSNASFHLDFKETTNSAELWFHVNILSSGKRTAWIFITDKTLPSIS